MNMSRHTEFVWHYVPHVLLLSLFTIGVLSAYWAGKSGEWWMVLTGAGSLIFFGTSLFRIAWWQGFEAGLRAGRALRTRGRPDDDTEE